MARDAATFSIDFKVEDCEEVRKLVFFSRSPFRDVPGERRLDLLAERDDALLFTRA